MTPVDRLLTGLPVRIDYHGRAVDVTFRRDPIDHIRLDDARGGRITLRFMPRRELAAWLDQHNPASPPEGNIMHTIRRSLAALFAVAVTFASATPVAAQDALTLYAPDATYTWAGEVLAHECAAQSYCAAGFVMFDDSGIPPIVDSPTRFRDAWTFGHWTLELSATQATVTQCRLWDIDYMAGNTHVYLRCTNGPPI